MGHRPATPPCLRELRELGRTAPSCRAKSAPTLQQVEGLFPRAGPLPRGTARCRKPGVGRLPGAPGTARGRGRGLPTTCSLQGTHRRTLGEGGDTSGCGLGEGMVPGTGVPNQHSLPEGEFKGCPGPPGQEGKPGSGPPQSPRPAQGCLPERARGQFHRDFKLPEGHLQNLGGDPGPPLRGRSYPSPFLSPQRPGQRESEALHREVN